MGVASLPSWKGFRQASTFKSPGTLTLNFDGDSRGTVEAAE
jgi:hypothetical protein